MKQPQNSYPFYVPKAKYNTGGSTGSTGNSGSGASTKIIMPETISTQHEKSMKNEAISPKKKDYADILQTEQIGSKAQNLMKNPSHLYQGVSSSSSFSTNSFKGLNFSMGSDFK